MMQDDKIYPMQESLEFMEGEKQLDTTLETEFKDVQQYIRPRNLNSYNLIQLLGKGGQGEVWKVKIKDTGQIIALKIMKASKNSNIISVLNEIDALEKISEPSCHPFLSCYYRHFYNGDIKQYLIEMEYIDGIELDVWAKKFWDSRNYAALYHNLLHLTKDLAHTFKFINNNGLIHRDVKPQNILITKNNIPKLIDFGFACDYKICNLRLDNKSPVRECCKGYVGTPVFSPPEVIEYGISYPVSDIWSLGSTLYYLATGNFAYNFTDKSSVESVLLTIIDKEPHKLNTENILLNEIVNLSLIKDPKDRLTIDQLIKMLK